MNNINVDYKTNSVHINMVKVIVFNVYAFIYQIADFQMLSIKSCSTGDNTLHSQVLVLGFQHVTQTG